MRSGKVQIDVALPADIKAQVMRALKLGDLKTDALPMRWVKGDTPAHEDRGTEAFQTTHLVYLDDSEGSLVVGDTLLPIKRGSLVTFPEGTRHATTNTGSTPRLLIGPMSERAQAVGSSISRPGGTTIYFRQTTDL
jgi:hypothetical protein